MADVMMDMDIRIAQLTQLQGQQMQELKIATTQLVIQLTSMNTVFSAVTTLLERPAEGSSKMQSVFKVITRSILKMIVRTNEQNRLRIAIGFVSEWILMKVLKRQWQRFKQNKQACKE